jgi:hypothetical protein
MHRLFRIGRRLRIIVVSGGEVSQSCRDGRHGATCDDSDGGYACACTCHPRLRVRTSS